MGEVKIKMCHHPGGVQRTIPSHLEPKLGHLLEKNPLNPRKQVWIAKLAKAAGPIS